MFERNSDTPKRGQVDESGERDVLDQMDDGDDFFDDIEDIGEGEDEGAAEDDARDEESSGEEEEGLEQEKEQDSRVNDQGQEAQKYVTPRVTADKKGNLVDQNGKIIAPAGPARRFYEDKIRAERGLHQASQKLNYQSRVMTQAGQAINYMKNQLEAVQKNQDLPKQLGLTPDEHVEFVQLAAKWKSNPVDVVKYLLTRAAQRGIKLDELNVPGGGLDLSVITGDITKQLDERLKPITDRFNESESIAADRRKQEMELLALQGEGVPESALKVVHAMGEAPEFRGMAARERWLHLQNYLLRQRGTRPAQRRERPSGRARPGAQFSGRGSIDDSPVSVDQDYKDIVKSVIADHGYPDGTNR